jgi:hypothetical protein
MEWNKTISGLLVPGFSSPAPMSSLPAGWPSSKPERRIFVKRGDRPIDPPPGSWSQRDLHVHVKGRADCTGLVLLGVAVLKQKGLIWNHVVSYTGAVWQDWEGSTPYSNRAHRVPCNPTITNRNIPDIAPTRGFQDALIEPLAKTDFLPKIANHCDSRFEALGAAAAFAAAIRLVTREQERDRPINFDLFHHALQGIALAGYKAAYEAVLLEASNYINEESGPELLERNENHSERRPKTNIETVQETAHDLLHYTSQSSTYLNPMAFKNEIARLDRLASGSDIITKPFTARI